MGPNFAVKVIRYGYDQARCHHENAGKTAFLPLPAVSPTWELGLPSNQMSWTISAGGLRKQILKWGNPPGRSDDYQAFPAAEARRILRRLEFHYVPKHASWLNMLEIGVLRGQCLDRRIATREQLESEIAA